LSVYNGTRFAGVWRRAEFAVLC